jgi:hypothetical protein
MRIILIAAAMVSFSAAAYAAENFNCDVKTKTCDCRGGRTSADCVGMSRNCKGGMTCTGTGGTISPKTCTCTMNATRGVNSGQGSNPGQGGKNPVGSIGVVGAKHGGAQQ